MDDLINRQALLRDIEKYHLSDGKFQHWVEVQPSVEAEPVVRCKDCKWFNTKGCAIKIMDESDKPHEDDFCSFAERTVDAVPVVRCKDCKNSEHWYRDRRRCFLWSEDGVSVFDNGFCNYGELKQ